MPFYTTSGPNLNDPWATDSNSTLCDHGKGDKPKHSSSVLRKKRLRNSKSMPFKASDESHKVDPANPYAYPPDDVLDISTDSVRSMKEAERKALGIPDLLPPNTLFIHRRPSHVSEQTVDTANDPDNLGNWPVPPTVPPAVSLSRRERVHKTETTRPFCRPSREAYPELVGQAAGNRGEFDCSPARLPAQPLVSSNLGRKGSASSAQRPNTRSRDPHAEHVRQRSITIQPSLGSQSTGSSASSHRTLVPSRDVHPQTRERTVTAARKAPTPQPASANRQSMQAPVYLPPSQAYLYTSTTQPSTAFVPPANQYTLNSSSTATLVPSRSTGNPSGVGVQRQASVSSYRSAESGQTGAPGYVTGEYKIREGFRFGR
ncbi:hypothetical protein JAAARDRAFT_268666 [Jaapia argillacea MUCL 33604]|uniref:Uncharacterized protein n=1 Tax=Jaapia argillacea MUCL 33604 TaxID=933084 RepID=A0A067Q4R3_9AGAM|nr:hypothetical protein JAAARDRAFT_268666 [Jaapia argillacea MUCL 33604]